MWRPKGWNTAEIYAATDDDLIEAGADAMLEALRSSRERHDILTVTLPISEHWMDAKSVKGKWVFIPDELEDVIEGDSN